MDGAPDDEGPLGAVPEAADDHDGHEVEVGAGGAEAVATEGDVEVVAEEGGEGDVPAAPELGDGGGFVGGVEVFDEVEAEEFGEADGHVGVGGEVEVDLEGVSEDAGPGDEGGEVAIACSEGGVGDEAHGIREEDFFGEPEAEAGEAEREFLDGMLPVPHLMGDDAVADDGAGDEVGEEGDEAGEVEEGFGGFGMAAVEVDAVAEALEDVEGDACGEDDVAEEFGDGDVATAEPGGEGLGGLDGEGGVFEEGEGTEVGDDGEDDAEFAAGLVVARVGDHAAEVVVEGGGAEHEQHEPGVPPAVEDHAGAGEEEVAEGGAGAGPEQEVVDADDERQEVEDEDVGAEDHAGGLRSGEEGGECKWGSMWGSGEWSGVSGE